MPLPKDGEKWGDMTLSLQVRKNDGSGDVLNLILILPENKEKHKADDSCRDGRRSSYFITVRLRFHYNYKMKEIFLSFYRNLSIRRNDIQKNHEKPSQKQGFFGKKSMNNEEQKEREGRKLKTLKAQKVKICMLMTVLLILSGGFSAFAAQTTFSDINEAPWAKEYIIKMADAKIISGYFDEKTLRATFKPNQPVSYVEAVQMIYNTLKAASKLKTTASVVSKQEDLLKANNIPQWALKRLLML